MTSFFELTAAFFCAICFVYAIAIAPYSWGSHGVMAPQAHATIEDGLLSPEFCRQGSPTRVYLSDMAFKIEQMGGIQ